MISVSEALQE